MVFLSATSQIRLACRKADIFRACAAFASDSSRAACRALPFWPRNARSSSRIIRPAEQSGPIAISSSGRSRLHEAGTVDGLEFLINKLKESKSNAEFFDAMNT
jgi:hypothetical protein